MARCDVCGNEYEGAFTVSMRGRTRTFDSFECAIHDLAPRCVHCECRVIGHGIQAGGAVYCCAHCARQGGVTNVRDNAAQARAD